MPRVLTTLRMDKRRAEAEIVRVWNNLLDPTLAVHAQPTGLNKGTLFVTVDSHVWQDEILRYRRRVLLKQLRGQPVLVLPRRFHALHRQLRRPRDRPAQLRSMRTRLLDRPALCHRHLRRRRMKIAMAN